MYSWCHENSSLVLKCTDGVMKTVPLVLRGTDGVMKTVPFAKNVSFFSQNKKNAYIMF